MPPRTGDISHLTYPVPAQLPGAATDRCTSHIPLTRCQLSYPVPPRTGDISHLTYPVPAQLPGAATDRTSHISLTRCQLSYPVPARLPGASSAARCHAAVTRRQLSVPQLAYPVPYSAENVLRAIWPGPPCLPGELPRVCPLLSLPALPHGTPPHNSLTLCASLPCSHLTYLVPAPGYLVDLRPTAPLGSPEPSPTILV